MITPLSLVIWHPKRSAHNHPWPRYLFSLVFIVTMLSPTLKVLSAIKKKPLSNPAHTASTNGMKISTINKDSLPVSIMDISPANALNQRKAASFEHLVWTVSKLNVLHTSSELIHFMSQQLHIDTRSSFQEVRSVSNYVWNWMVCIATLKPQAFLDGNMDEVTTDMINKTAKWLPRIKLMRFCCTAKGCDLDSRIGPCVASSLEFCLRLPQHF